MAMLTLAAPSAPCLTSLRLATSGTTASCKARLMLCAKGFTNLTSLRLQTALVSPKPAPQRRRWSCQAGSADQSEIVAAGEEKVSEVKASVSEKQGPPFLTIIAGIVVAVLVLWGLWSLAAAIAGIFFR